MVSGFHIEKSRQEGKIVELKETLVAFDRWKTRRAAARELFERLTPREKEVLQLAAAGEPIKGTAAKLALGRKTVEQHRLRLTKKLGVHNMLSAVVVYTECGFWEEKK